MTGRVALAVVLVLATTAAAAERPPAEIAGSVTAHRAGAVQVSFGSHPEAVPRVGDRVEFSVEIDGIRVDAGAGKVLDVTRQSAWVEIEKGRPDLGMQARIHATGRLDRQEAGADAPLQEPGRAVRAYLGVQVKPLGRELAGALGLDTWAGALVEGVASGSPAETAGFRKNDLIVEFDGKTIDEMLELHRRVAVTPVGQEVAVKVLRGGKPLTLAVKLGKLPALPALPPPDGDGLQPRVLGRGVAQILVPVGLPMIEDKKTGSRWRVSSPETDRLTDAWWMLVFDLGEVRRPLEEEHSGLAARIFAESKDAPRWRWRNRRISAAMECLASSTTLFRYASWSVLCRKDGRDYVIHVTADSGPLRDPDAVIERIVRSFRVGDDVTWYAVPPPPRIDALEPQTLDGIVALELPVGLRMWRAPITGPIRNWRFRSARNIDMVGRWAVGIEDAGPIRSLGPVVDAAWKQVEGLRSLVERFRAQQFPGAYQCVGNSLDLFGHREWGVFCVVGDRLVRLDFDLEVPVSPAEGDDVVQRMVQSLRVLR